MLKEALGKSGLSQRLLYKVFVPVRQALFVVTLLLIATILTLFTYNYLNPQNVFLKICAVIIPFSFYLEFADKIVNYIIRKTVKPKILPRFNFSKTIDENNKTYVVMPTIISSLCLIIYLKNKSEEII